MTLNPCPTEQQEGEALVAWLRLKGYRFTHIGNETGSDPAARRRAVRMKRAGVSRGFPDYLVFAEGQCIAIELKRQRGGRATPEQLEWLDTLAAHGFRAAVCKGAEDAIGFVERVVGGRNTRSENLSHSPACAIFRKPTPSGCMWCCDCKRPVIAVRNDS